ncbi:N utilization substance protein B [Mesonia hippocampi]|uniref:N utilization substance protein B n=1 Tax=Mesonia hippocampi TaxID=1628250 RepID=A0A840ESM7_9FLAO|nr:transcription antitermination factor NusB [Mesonia hippocampi]MBB4120045.1 N utilization substance protein B [Mesonia hippocampi]
MLTRRHIRVKVMQSLYAFNQAKPDRIEVEEKFLKKSMEDMYDLFLLQLALLVEIKNKAKDYLDIVQKKRLATSDDRNPNYKFTQNRVIELLEQNEYFQEILEDRKLHHWKKDDEYVNILWNEVKESQYYHDYTQTRTSSFQEDKDFLISIFKEIIAPNPKLYDYIEDKKLTWLDDFPIVNTSIVKSIQKVKEKNPYMAIPRLFKNQEDQEFALDLFRKTLLNRASYENDIVSKTPKWDKERIAEIDRILLDMSVCEFLKFPSIPVKVTINESIEIAKEYSTNKSSIFINGVLDKLSKEYQENGKLNKIGRGLM